MHPNPAFRTAGQEQNLAFARDRAFGILTLGGADGPLVSHIPFILSEDNTSLGAHIVRSNPIWRAIETPQQAVMVVSGPDGYVSPDWYDVDDQVPTWNYVAVHLRGTLKRLDHGMLHDHAAQLSDQFETRLTPKPVWTMDKMQPETITRMQRMIVPVQMDIETVDGTWKLNQNKDVEARRRAASEIAGSPVGMETRALADLMRQAMGSADN